MFFSTASIFAVTFLLMGFQVIIAFIVTFTVAMIVTDIMGLMYLWSIPLNAVSLVNLVMVSDRFMIVSHLNSYSIAYSNWATRWGQWTLN